MNPPPTFKPGEFKKINNAGVSIRDNIYHMQHAGPSPVLFNLLGFMVEAGKEVANTKDILDASMSANMPATTTMAIVEQGMIQYGAIFKRIFRGLKEELKKLFRLNRIYLDPQVYFRYQDQDMSVMRGDYEDNLDIVPVADPKSVSDMQKLTKASFLMQFISDPAMNAMEIKRRVLEAAGIPDIDKLFNNQPPPPNPELEMKLMEAERKEEELDLKRSLSQAQTIKTIAEAMLAVAKAEAQEIGNQAEEYQAVLQQLGQGVMNGMGRNRDAGQTGMVAEPSDAGVQEPPLGDETIPGAGLGVGPVDPSGGMGNPASPL